MINNRIFREYDIRGIAGKDISRDFSLCLGKAFASYVKCMNPQAQWVSVGRDVRVSSEDLAAGVVEGITSAGINVYDIGICPTPLQYFSLFHLDLDGGIMVTGSHNPPEYNGFKLSVGKETIHGITIQRIKEIMMRKEDVASPNRGTIERYDIVGSYKKYMFREFSSLKDSRYKRFKVVVDAGNGTAGILVPELISGVGCEVVPLFCEPDGNFPNHHPDPTVIEYLQDLITETIKSEADIGVAYDGDADRIGVVNREGDIVWGDELMIVLSRELLREQPGAKIIGDVKCSQVMFDDIKDRGGVPIMWRTGHSLIKQKMKDEGALIAGEFSGHIFLGDRYFGYDDAIYTTLRLIEIMKRHSKDIKELLSDVPKVFFTPEIRLDCPEDRKRNVVEKVVARFIQYSGDGQKSAAPYAIRGLDTTDGVRVLFENGWGLVRMSNTQPVIVMRVEAKDERSLNGYRVFLEREVNEVMAAI